MATGDDSHLDFLRRRQHLSEGTVTRSAVWWSCILGLVILCDIGASALLMPRAQRGTITDTFVVQSLSRTSETRDVYRITGPDIEVVVSLNSALVVDGAYYGTVSVGNEIKTVAYQNGPKEVYVNGQPRTVTPYERDHREHGQDGKQTSGDRL
jgi:hypothetical protein